MTTSKTTTKRDKPTDDHDLSWREITEDLETEVERLQTEVRGLRRKLDDAEAELEHVKRPGVLVVELRERHLEWLRGVAAKEGRTLEQMVDRIIRIDYSKDPYKSSGGPQRGMSNRAGDIPE